MNEQKPIESCASIPSQFVHRYAPNCQEVEMYIAHLEGCVEGFTKSLKQSSSRDIRKELWVGVAIAISQSSNSTTKYTMEKWADHALAEFDKRFGETK